MREVDSRVVAKAFGKHRNEAVAKGGLIVTKYGVPTVVMVPYADYERMRALFEGSSPNPNGPATWWPTSTNQR